MIGRVTSYFVGMSRLFQGKYRIDTIRLPGWDYGSNASYFVTICTKSRIHWFGKVQQGQMKLSEIGKIADRCWLEIPAHFPFVKLGEHVVMPDHVHGILIIDKPVKAVPPQPPKFGPQSRNLASIIRGYKAGVTIFSRKVQPRFMWQSRYYEHIIRDDKAFRNISRYIRNNPVNWDSK